MPTVRTPDDPALDELCQRLCERADNLDTSGQWPTDQLRWCAEYGIFRWFLPERWGGLGWSEADCIRGYLRMSAACLTTTFILTQRTGACRRISDSENQVMQSRWLPDLARGAAFATVGISHLTTSRRHLQKPVLSVTETDAGFLLDGFSPWVTGADQAQCVVTGGTLADGQQILVALPTDTAGVSIPEPARLVGLAASHTGEMRCEQVHIPWEWVLAGPVENIISHGAGTGTGGLQTSTLALGLARAAIDYLDRESHVRNDLMAPAAALDEEWQRAVADLLALAAGQEACSSESLRGRANGLALRASQSALAAAKGTGYLVGHPAGRWCREALFFLVWSCPQGVLQATLCELAGLE